MALGHWVDIVDRVEGYSTELLSSSSAITAGGRRFSGSFPRAKGVMKQAASLKDGLTLSPTGDPPPC